MRPRSLLPLLAAALLAGVPPAAAASTYAPGEVVVRYDEDASLSARARLRERTGIGRSQRLPGGTRRFEILDGQSVAQTLRELRRQPGVRFACPNYLARASAIFPNDPGTGRAGDWIRSQWNFFGPASVNAPEAWENLRAAGAPGGRGAVVAVIDTGVAYQSRGPYRRAPDLSPQSFVPGYDFVANDRFPNDANGHGTHITGTIAERTDNGYGLTGLAYGARIMPLRALDSRGEGDSVAISRAIRFAASRGADVINLSLEFESPRASSSQIPEVALAIKYARDRGVTVVAAAGNQADTRIAYPARANHVISVGATTSRRCQAEYSNEGTGLDISAPGGGFDTLASSNPRDARACRPNRAGRLIYQQSFRSSLRTFAFRGEQGTSMASSHVSAAAALVIASGVLGPDPSPDAIDQRLEETATDLGPEGYDRRYGAGLLDAAAATAPSPAG